MISVRSNINLLHSFLKPVDLVTSKIQEQEYGLIDYKLHWFCSMATEISCWNQKRI